MHRLKNASLFIVRTLVITVIVSAFGRAFPGEQEAHATVDKRLLKNLGIISFSQPHLASDFTLRDLSGNAVSLSHFRGKVVFLNFWATWCSPCRHEMPSMDALYNRFKGRGLVVLAVDMREDRAPVAKFMNNLGLNFPALLDVHGSVSSLYGVTGLPTTYIIDPKGNIIGKRIGPKDWAAPDVMALFQSLLKVDKVPPSPFVSTAAVPVPSVLFVKSSEASVYAQQDQSSEAVASLKRGEKLIPLAQAFGGGSPWYMVKTQQGAVGWVKASDVEEDAKREP